MNGWETCHVCGQWERSRTMKTHMNSMHGTKNTNVTAEGKFVCTACPSTFRRKANLRRHHQLVHNKALPIGPLQMITELPKVKKEKFIIKKPTSKLPKNFDPTKIKFRIVYNHSAFYRERYLTTCTEPDPIKASSGQKISEANQDASTGVPK